MCKEDGGQEDYGRGDEGCRACELHTGQVKFFAKILTVRECVVYRQQVGRREADGSYCSLDVFVTFKSGQVYAT